MVSCSIRVMHKILAKKFATAVGESWNLVLFSAAVEASCFARVLIIVRCGTRHDVSCNLSRRFREDCGTSCVTDYTV